MACTVCGEEISKARLKAIPDATRCIECASKNDVPLLKRYDDHTADGAVSETYYTNNKAIDAEVERLKNFNPHLVGEDGRYYPAASITEDEEEISDHVEIRPVDTPPHHMTQTPTMGLTVLEHRRDLAKLGEK